MGLRRKPKALICGISGQDGAYLASLLLKKGYELVGTSRDAGISKFTALSELGLRGRISLRSMSPTDFRSVLTTINDTSPDEVYNLSGQTSVGLSFEQPVETLESIAVGTLNFLESIRFLGNPIKFYNAGSSECFGETKDDPADETTPFRPRSPYAVAKSAAHMMVANYRDAYGLFACNGILFNHESPLRPLRFVTRKIVNGACAIKLGHAEKLALGDIKISRDWGLASEYVEAMWQILQADSPDDYVIATGETNSLESFVEATFAELGLDWQRHVTTDPSLRRPAEISYNAGNPKKAFEVLGWRATSKMHDLVKILVRAELQSLQS